MELLTLYWFDGIYFGMAFLALVVNVMLITIAIKLRHLGLDMRLSIALASMGMILPFTSSGVALANLFWISEEDGNWGCQVKGPLDYIVVSYSMMLVSVIAVIRYFRAKHQPLPQKIWNGTILFAIIYLMVMIMAGSQYGLFRVSNDLNCAPSYENSDLSIVSMVLFSSSLLVLICIIFGCHMGIIYQVNHHHETREMNSTKLDPDVIHIDLNAPELHTLELQTLRHHRQRVCKRIGMISTLHFILALSAVILMMVDVALDPHHQSLEGVQMAGTICFLLLMVANPCLVLLSHSKMMTKLTQICRLNKTKLLPSPSQH